MCNKKMTVSLDKTNDLIQKISTEILKKHKINNIIAIARGGIVPSRYFSKYLGTKRIYVIGIEFYDDESNKPFKIPYIYQGLTNTFTKNDTVLLADDVIDTGESMTVAINEARNKGATNIITCTLHYKPKSKYKPNFYGEEIPNDVWIKYEWEK